MRTGRDPCTGLLQPPEGGQGGLDAQVVGDLTVGHRHVEVDSDEDRLALEAAVVAAGDVALVAGAAARLLHEGLGLRSGHEHPGVYVKGAGPELPLPHQIGHRLPLEATPHQLAVAAALGVVQGAVQIQIEPHPTFAPHLPGARRPVREIHAPVYFGSLTPPASLQEQITLIAHPFDQDVELGSDSKLQALAAQGALHAHQLVPSR